MKLKQTLTATAMAAALLTTSMAANAYNLMVKTSSGTAAISISVNGSNKGCKSISGSGWKNTGIKVKSGDKVDVRWWDIGCYTLQRDRKARTVPSNLSTNNYWFGN